MSTVRLFLNIRIGRRILFLLALTAILCNSGCNLSDLRDQDNRLGQNEVPDELREKWFHDTYGKETKRTAEIASEQISSEKFPLEEKEFAVPERMTPVIQKDSTEPLIGTTGENYFSEDETVNADFNFSGAKLSQIIPVFAQMLGFSYVLEGDITATATISMHDTLSKKELWTIFANLIRVSNLSMNFDGKILRVRNASAIPTELTLDNMNPNVELGVFHLKNITVSKLSESIRKLLPRDLRIIELTSSNTLLILDTVQTMPQIERIIQELDRPATENLNREIIVCQEIAPSQIEAELKKILPILGFSVASTGNAQENPGMITLTSVNRLNLLIASAANQDALRELRQWVSTLDNGEQEQEQLYIYDIVHSRADFLVNALSTMFTVTGSMVGFDAAGKVLEKTDIGTPSTIKSNAETVPGSVFDTPVRIWADNNTNRLSIRTRPKTYATIKAYLDRLDTIPAQVQLRVIVLEITLTDTVQFGMEFMTQNAINGWESSSGTDWKYLTPGTNSDQYGAKFWIYDPSNPDSKLAYVNALAGQNNIKIISNPVLNVLNNQTASMNVGDEVPIITADITDTSSSSTTGTTLVRSVSYKDTGVLLKVTPKITRGGRITLSIEQSVSEAQANTTSTIDSPQVSTREVITTLSMRDGQTVVCGGMIREKVSDNLDTLPLINNIPFLRRMLGSTNSSATRSEMLILITGNIITEESQLEQMTKGYEHSVNTIIEFSQDDRSKNRFTTKGDPTQCFWK